MSKKDKFDFNASNLIAYLLKRFKILAVISLIAGVITAVFSLFIHNKFKSEVVLLPTAQVSVSRTLSDMYYGKGKGEIESVGEEEELDELQQMLNSGDLTARLTKEFHLMEHYRINPNSKAANKKLYSALSSNLKISRTQFGSVSVEVWDEDPKVAADMANFIPVYLDTLFFNMERERYEKSYLLVKSEYDSLSNHIQVLIDSLKVFNKMGLLDIAPQIEELTKAYYKALLKGRSDVAQKIEKVIKVIQDNEATFIVLRDDIVYNQKQLALLAGKLTMAKVGVKEKLPRKFVVNRAYPADYKDSPKRSIIVLVSMIITFFTALMIFIIAENIKKLK